MIVISATCNVATEGNSKPEYYIILGDLGVGIFPTGIIGYILEKMQRREKEEQRHKRRSAILYGIIVSIHSYFNSICNAALTEYPKYKNCNVFEIIQLIKDETIVLAYSSNELDMLRHLIIKIKDIFEFPDPTYIVSDVFEEKEENHFHLLIKEGEDLVTLIENNICKSSKRCDFLSYLEIACEEIPEFRQFLQMTSNGKNIFIPKPS